MAVIIQFPIHKRGSAAGGEQQTAGAVVLPFAPVRRRRARQVADDLPSAEAQRTACVVAVNASPARTD
jgi:hypothetical protein